MAFELKDLTLEEVSAVDTPANKGSRVVLLKRGTDAMEDIWNRIKKALSLEDSQIEDVQKALDEEVSKGDKDMTDKELAEKVEALTKSVGDLTAAQEKSAKTIETLTKENEALKAEAQKADDLKSFRSKLPKGMQKAFDDMDEEEQRSFMNRYQKAENLDDDPVGKALAKSTEENEALKKRLAVLEKKDALAVIKEDLKDLEGVVKVEEVAEDYLALAETSKEAADRMIETLRATVKRGGGTKLFEVLGKDGVPEGSAEAEINKRVADYRRENPDVSAEKAEAIVLEREPELYKRFNEENGKAA